MKKSVILILIAITFFTCKKKEQTSFANGKWKLIERCDDPSGGESWHPVPDSLSYFYELNNDYTYSKSGNYASTGTYSYEILNNGYFMLIFNHQNTKDSITSRFDENQNLIMIYECIEGCFEKFKKIN